MLCDNACFVIFLDKIELLCIRAQSSIVIFP